MTFASLAVSLGMSFASSFALAMYGFNVLLALGRLSDAVACSLRFIQEFVLKISAFVASLCKISISRCDPSTPVLFPFCDSPRQGYRPLRMASAHVLLGECGDVRLSG